MNFRISEKAKGILFILSAAFFFALMNLFVKTAGDIPVMQKSFFRNLVAAVIAMFTLLRSGERFYIGKSNLKYMLIRCGFGTAGILMNFYAIGILNIADASMLNKLSPFFAIIFSIYILKENPTRKEWLAVIIAFIGAMFVIRPSFNWDTFPAIMGTLGGMCAGLAYTCVRRLGQGGVKGPVIVFCFSAFSCLVCAPGMILHFAPMTAWQLTSLLLAGASAAGGQFSITAAYTHAPAKEISVFDYTQVLFAAMLSFFVLGDMPDALSFVGYAIIIGVAVWKWKKA